MESSRPADRLCSGRERLEHVPAGILARPSHGLREAVCGETCAADHGDGPDDHDDLVIGWLLCYYFLLSAKNKSYYGIPSNSVLSTVQNLMLAEKGGAEEVEKKEKQMALKETIDNLLASMKEKNDPIYSRLTELKVRRLYNYVDHSIIPAYNIESLLDNIKIEQQKSGFKHIRYYAA